MALNKRLLISALLVTLFIFSSVLFIGSVFNNKRTDIVYTKAQQLYEDIDELQTLFIMADTYGDEMACLAFKTRLEKMDENVWDLGKKIDDYRSATEEFQKDPFYKEQKILFNKNELFYLLLIEKLKERCNHTQTVVLFFYKNSKDCAACDDQSFVLSDIKRQAGDEVSMFFFDMDLDITAINLLVTYYKTTEYPCVVINNNNFCGIKNKDFIIKKICEDQNITICS